MITIEEVKANEQIRPISKKQTKACVPSVIPNIPLPM